MSRRVAERLKKPRTRKGVNREKAVAYGIDRHLVCSMVQVSSVFTTRGKVGMAGLTVQEPLYASTC